jgi:hypothetical protein
MVKTFIIIFFLNFPFYSQILTLLSIEHVDIYLFKPKQLPVTFLIFNIIFIVFYGSEFIQKTTINCSFTKLFKS